MAPRDRTTDVDTHDSTDDWFDNPAAVEPDPVADAPDNQAGRRLTVLPERHLVDNPDDDWFRDIGDHPDAHQSDPHAEYNSFDTRTAVLRNTRTYSTPQPPSPPSWWRQHRSAIAVTAAIAVLGGGITGTAVLLTDISSEPEPTAPMAIDEIVTTTASTPTSTAPAAAGAAAANVTWCKGQADGDPVTENSNDPGAAAIWRFEKAFYFDRDAAAARAAGAPDAVMGSAARLQEGIDQLEPAVEFCVLADPIDAGIYDVTVVERGPGIDGRISGQRITTTTQPGGQTLISAIVPRPL
ncbi:hypothetical protein [Rhodococcoides kyotonense]|uniref:DUF8176 domain-containing protein n=1 Tax=Rhodococcoides kyotonense TaxID=398843 RepID=A0A177YEN1_9NOCA|nr:hypothetical protein [Rhodococcus kyotonensis]OAK53790.1 hypothetical protein A3K89_21965 [Rhodococcus kyotonensis]